MLKKIRASLTFKSFTIIFAAVLTGIASFSVLSGAGAFAAEKISMSRAANTRRMEILEKDFMESINPNGESCKSKKEVLNWLEDKPGVSVYAYDFNSGQLLFESDGHFFTEYRDGESEIYIGRKADFLTVRYQDMTCRVVIRDNSYMRYFRVIDILSLLISFAIVMVILVCAFNKYLIKRIIRISKQAKAVSFGELSREINVDGTDELYELGSNIDNMRKAIITYYEKEQDAIKANNEMLTSISHDIRTPLTSIIGYSEMMSDERTTDIEEMKKYAEVCKDKAYRLKELTDTMFRYFYVYGKDLTDINSEIFYARLLLDQIFGELTAEIMQEGYTVEISEEIEERTRIIVDIDLIKRVIDNVFSNLKKYADKSKTVFINGKVQNNVLEIEIRNTVMHNVRTAESTKIGLKTCSRIMESMGGKIEVRTENDIFTERIYIPVIK